MARRAVGNALLRPPRLRPGDLVAVVATSGVVPEDRLRAGVERLEAWGLGCGCREHVLDGDRGSSYLAGSDEDRAADFTAAWLDPDGLGGRGPRAAATAPSGWSTCSTGAGWPRRSRRCWSASPTSRRCTRRWPPGSGSRRCTGTSSTSLGAATEASAEELAPAADGARRRSPTCCAGRSRDDRRSAASPTGCWSAATWRCWRPTSARASAARRAGGIVVLEDVGEEPYRIDRHAHPAGPGRLVRRRARGRARRVHRLRRPEPRSRRCSTQRLAPLGVPTVRGCRHRPHRLERDRVPLGVAPRSTPTPGRLRRSPRRALLVSELA